MLSILPLAVGMLPINAMVYVFDGILVGASDFKFMAGEPWTPACWVLFLSCQVRGG